MQSNTSDTEPIRVSPSRLAVYISCPKKFDYIYRQGLRKKEVKTHFDLGNYIHELLHVYYQTLKASPGVDRDFLSAMIQTRIKNDAAHVRPEHLPILNKARKHVTRFIQFQSKIIDRGITVEEIEYEYDVPVTLPSGRIVNLYGFIDLLYRTLRKKLVVRDHKSTSSPKNHTDKTIEWEIQLFMYGAVIYLLTGEPPATEFNILSTYEYKKAPTDNEFKLITTHHSAKVFENYLAETLRLIDEMLDSKPTPHYSRECSSCPFKELCALELQGASIVRIREANYERTDPNAPKRPAFAEDNPESNDTSRTSSNFVPQWGN